MEMHADKNYYDKNGILLLAKDQEITDHTLLRLRKHEACVRELTAANRQCDERIRIGQISKKLNAHDKSIFDVPAMVLSEIMFESRRKPWFFVINALSNYISWVYTHSINVGLISLILADSLGYSQQAMWEIGLGALLHDVGKLMIPKSIIQKPEKLSHFEMLNIQQHCELGVGMVADYEVPENSRIIILQHHERNDGSGYPFGLERDNIHQYARIVMVADVVDAITSHRPYRPAKTIETAISILKSDKEKFSAKLVDCLKEALK